LPEKGTKALPV